MTSYNLTPEQAHYFRSLKAGERMTFVVPLREQPEEGSSLLGKIQDCYPPANYCQFSQPNGTVFIVKLTYPLNSTVGLREAWAHYYSGKGATYVYKADYTDKDWQFVAVRTWHSSQTMPSDAITDAHNWAKVVDTRVCRVQEVTPEEMKLSVDYVKHLPLLIPKISKDKLEQLATMVAESVFKQWFTSRYSTPRPVRQHGKIVGYRCLFWSESEFDDFIVWDKYVSNIKKDNSKFLWKDKPLTIHINPFVKVVTVEKGESDD